MDVFKDMDFKDVIVMVIALLALIGAYNAFATARKNIRDERREQQQPIANLDQRVTRHDDLLQKDKDRMDKMEAKIADMGAESTIILRGVRALLSHSVNGNSVDKLEKSMTEIDDFLISRK